MKASRKLRPVRTRIHFRVDVRGARHFVTTEARDISIDGLCLFSETALGIGERAGVTLHFPGGFQTTLSAEVRWVRPEGPRHCLLGIAFDHSPESRKILQKLIWQIESGTIKGV